MTCATLFNRNADSFQQLLLFYTPGSIGPGVKSKEQRLKANVEWLEVQIVVPSKWLMEQGRIRTLDCDWQPLENERPFSAVTRQFTDPATKIFEETVCSRVVRWAQGLHGNARTVYAEGMSAYFWHFLAAASSATSPHPRAAVAT